MARDDEKKDKKESKEVQGVGSSTNPQAEARERAAQESLLEAEDPQAEGSDNDPAINTGIEFYMTQYVGLSRSALEQEIKNNAEEMREAGERAYRWAQSPETASRIRAYEVLKGVDEQLKALLRQKEHDAPSAEARGKFEDAEKMAELARLVKVKDVSGVDILHMEAGEVNDVISGIKKGDIASVEDLPEEYREDPLIISELLNQDNDRSYGEFIFSQLPEKVKDDARFMEDLSKRLGWSVLRFSSDQLKGDRDFVDRQLELSPEVLVSASEALRNDRALNLKAMKLSIKSGVELVTLHYLEKQFKDDKEFILEVMKDSGKEAMTILGSISKKLQDDLDVVITAVREDPHAIIYASLRIRELIAKAAEV